MKSYLFCFDAICFNKTFDLVGLLTKEFTTVIFAYVNIVDISDCKRLASTRFRIMCCIWSRYSCRKFRHTNGLLSEIFSIGLSRGKVN